jgi:hypothetical protein
MISTPPVRVVGEVDTVVWVCPLVTIDVVVILVGNDDVGPGVLGVGPTGPTGVSPLVKGVVFSVVPLVVDEAIVVEEVPADRISVVVSVDPP